MKKIYIVLLIVVLLPLSLTGCKGEPGMTGYVMNKENGRILVVDPVPQDFSSTGGIDEFHNAISFSKAPENIKVGDKVEVWFDMVAESYPGQSEVKHIKVIEEKKPEGADLTPAEALNKVLTSNEIDQLSVPHSINYNKDTDHWTIQLKEIWEQSGKILEFQIED